ncbi:hypothetical protein D3C81_937020 [compost metagenome]
MVAASLSEALPVVLPEEVLEPPPPEPLPLLVVFTVTVALAFSAVPATVPLTSKVPAAEYCEGLMVSHFTLTEAVF